MSKKNICVWGDSIVKGHNDDAVGGWVSRLQKYLDERKLPFSVHRFGVSGTYTSTLLLRFEKEASQYQPDIVIFAIGTNDLPILLATHNPMVSLQKFKKNIDSLYQAAYAFTPDIVFVGLPIVDESKTTPIPWAPKSYYMKDVVEYNAVLENFCNSRHVPFVPLLDALRTQDLDDGIHPSPKGHEKIYIAVKDFLIEQKLI